MPRLSAWAVRLSLCYLLLGFTLGALMLSNKGVPFLPWAWNLLPGHIDILIFGFIIQLAIGIAYWILPRHRGGSRGNENLVWAALLTLNLGIWCAAIAGGLNLPAGWRIFSRLAEVSAAVLFALHAWQRIRPF